MARTVLIDEFHLTLRVPSDLPPAASRAITRTLDRPRLHAELRGAVRQVLRRYPALRAVRVRLSR